MDRLPCDLLHHIIWYIDQPLDLLRMFHVCSRWRSFIMNDEYFLNQWFSRSLERSQQPFSIVCFQCMKDSKKQSILHIDQSLFPINLRSSRCWVLPWTVSRYSSRYEHIFAHYYPLSLFDSSHSFSFWLFLPPQCKLNIQIGNFNVKAVTILLCGDEKYHFDKGKCGSISDRWIHIVLTKIDSQSNYRIWIDGQYASKLSQSHLSYCEMGRNFSWINIVLPYKFNNNLLEPSSKARIADINAFKRCLTLAEIRAIHQQQTSISQVKVGTYINSNEIHNMKVDYCCKSTIPHINSFSSCLLYF